MTISRSTFALLVVIHAVFWVPTVAHADLLTITLSGTGSGMLGVMPFSNASFTFVATSDTKSLSKPPCCNTLDTPSGTPTTFSVGSLTSGTLTDTQSFFVYPDGTIGLAHFNGGEVIDVFGSALANNKPGQ